MIKFFRKIRQKLLAENKTSKYLLYAIGEIFLVVIGILIALQINSWNQDYQNTKLSKTYLRELRADAQRDVEKLATFLKLATDYTTKVDALMSVRNNALLKEDLDEIGIVRQTYFITDGTLQEIIANGHLKLLPDNVKQVLMAQSALFKATNKIDGASTENVNKQFLKMAEYFELQRGLMPNEYKVISYPAQDTLKPLLVYRNFVNICYDWMNIQQNFYGRLKGQHVNIIQLIDEELEK